MWFRTQAMGILVAVATALSACGARQTPTTDSEEPESWRNRGLWVEAAGDRTYVNAVGVAPNASLGRTYSMPSAEEDARSKLSEYLGSVVKTFRERLQRMDTTTGKDKDGDVANAAQATQRNDTADRSVSDNVVHGMETINSYVDKDSDELFVLARVDVEQLYKTLGTSDALTESERGMVQGNSAEVRKEFEAATHASAPH